ncbi:MAG: tyrosine-type recombinase/integrase [Acidobacteria bacterium]|nr:tyrosine-type recombinase/integrase [Acidobacteriota bacterium]
MALYKRGGVFHYDFTMDGRRYRGTTKEKVASTARMIEAKLMQDAKQRKLTAQRRTLTLAEFSKRFLAWVESTRLEPESKKYYQSGWRMLSGMPIAGVRLAHITTDEAEALRFKHSPANANRALRTLRRMLGKAAEWGVIAASPRIKLVKEYGRSAIIDAEAEFKLLAVATQPLRDILTIILDTGMRPGEVFQMRWEDINWDGGMIFIPRGKTKLSRRFIPMSERVTKALHTRRKDATEGWVFPSDSVVGHITTVATAFETARAKARLSKDIVLYSARHTFATKIMGATGNLSLVMRALGHTNAQTAMIYQHPSLETVRNVVNENHLVIPLSHNSRHTVVM